MIEVITIGNGERPLIELVRVGIGLLVLEGLHRLERHRM